MTKLFDLLDNNSVNAIAKDSIEVGNVYRIKMNEKNGIKPKPGDDSRNKYFVVLGFDSNGDAYGGVIINSEINNRISPSIKDWQMPIKREKYNFLKHNSFVDCSRLKCADIKKFGSWQFMGFIDSEDVEIIISTIKDSPNETKAHLAMYGL